MATTTTSSTVPPPMTFDGHMADAETKITGAGFKLSLWKPEFGWNSSEDEAAADSFPAQMLAALQIFQHFFAATALRAWVHLAAEMQAGKTGVITTLIRLILANHDKLGITPQRVFVVTGMSDRAWLKQTRGRLPAAIRNGVYHNSTLSKFAKELHHLAAEAPLANIVVFVDESHIASSAKNLPNKYVYRTLASLCPRDLWKERNIRIVTVSATDPAKVMAIGETDIPCAVVRLQTTSEYQSIESLQTAGRIRYLEEFGDIMTVKGFVEFKRALTHEFSTAPLYHLIRAPAKKAAALHNFLTFKFPECDVQRYDAETKAKAAAGGDTSTVTSEIFNDINEMLAEPPIKPTFIILKNMFYAAKTLDDSHVGILWDRIGSKDDTNLQSLLGRACGYGKSSRTIVYASKDTVRNYLEFWRELCANSKIERIVDIPATKVDKKMPGVKASHVSANKARLTTTSAAASPYGVGVAYDPHAGPASIKEVADEENFTSEWKRYSTFEDAKKAAPRARAEKNEAGFYLCSTSGAPTKLRQLDILKMKNGKKTANMDWKKLEVGQSAHRLYVCYSDTNDASTAMFFVRTLTRNK